MKCLTPYTKVRDYKNQKGDLTALVPCGKCEPCLKSRSLKWAFRLQQEMKRSTSAIFLTLTYDDDHIPLSTNGNQTLQKTHYQKFLKRLREKNSKIPYTKKDGSTGYKSPIKYYACGEYGGDTERPHYHAIMLNVDQQIINHYEKLQSIWQNGHIDIKSANLNTIMYVTGYMHKGNIEPTHELDDRNKEFQLQSQGLGSNYLTPNMARYYRDHMLGAIRGENGKFLPMPRYYKDRIFNKQQRLEIAKEFQKLHEDIDLDQYDFRLERERVKDAERRQQKLKKQRIKI